MTFDDFSNECEQDELDATLDSADPQLVASLSQIMEVPADLASRTRDHVTSSLLDRSLLGTGADMLAVGWKTLALMLPPPPSMTPHNPPLDESLEPIADTQLRWWRSWSRVHSGGGNK